MTITSPAFRHNERIPKRYACEGEDISPPLRIDDLPAGTRSLALIVHDHDAPGGDFAHWLVWNIGPAAVAFPEGAAPEGAREGLNDFDRMGWGGPCPPSGLHRYEFHAYALDTVLELPAASYKTDLREAMRNHVLAEASLVGVYEKTAA